MKRNQCWVLWALIVNLLTIEMSSGCCYQDSSVFVPRSGSLKWHVKIVRWQKDDGATEIQNNYKPWHHPPSSFVFYPSHSSYLKAASARKDKVKCTSFLRPYIGYLHVFNLYTNEIWVFLGLTDIQPALMFKFLGFQIPRCRKKDRSAKTMQWSRDV